MPPKVGYRPAARVRAAPRASGRGVLRRPAAAVDDPIEAFKGFGEVRVASLPPGDLLSCGKVWVTEAHYWKEATQCLGLCKGLQAENGELWLDFQIEGTKSEHLLRYATGIPNRRLRAHLCRSDCTQETTGNDFFHMVKVKKWREEEKEPWMNNLLAVEREDADELVSLRREAQASGGEPKVKSKKKEKKDTQKEKEKKQEKKRARSSSPITGRKADRDLAVVLGGSGLDPNPKRWKKMMKKAKRIVKRRKKKKESSSSSSGTQSGTSRTSSSTGEMEAADIFGQRRMAKRVSSRCLGVLTATSLAAVQEQLLTTQGQIWELDRRELPPLFLQYFRGHLQQRMQPAAWIWG